nr:class I SAM-dependent methyltransferase [uncultured Butyrivibrio sp.]
MKNSIIKLIKLASGDNRCKTMFLYKMPHNPHVLDVGCGNNSPKFIKSRRPDVHYTGIDVCDYNQSGTSIQQADKYIISTPESFSSDIAHMNSQFDIVISAHNIEHCNNPMETIDAMCLALKSGGCLYMAFPSEKSISFPSRQGTLNFYDDPTHRYVPEFEKIIDALKQNGMSIDFAEKQYKPFGKYVLGSIIEKIYKKKVTRFTWAYYGFESVIWAHKEVD